MTRRTKVLLNTALLALLAIFGCLVSVGSLFCQATLHVPRRIAPPPAEANAVHIKAGD